MTEITYPMAKAPKGVKNETLRNVVVAAHNAYLDCGHVPSVADIAKFCSHTETTIAKIIQTSEFVWSIEKRGVNWGSSKGLTPEQSYAMSIITNPTDRRSLNAKLKSCGVSYSRYRTWLKDPTFSAFINKITDNMLGEHMGDVNTSFLNQALSGNMKAIQLYYEMTGRHNPAQQQVIDLQKIIGLLLEIITKHVTDTTTLTSISNEIERVMSSSVRRIESSLPVNPINFTVEDDLEVEAEVVTEKTADELAKEVFDF